VEVKEKWKSPNGQSGLSLVLPSIELRAAVARFGLPAADSSLALGALSMHQTGWNLSSSNQRMTWCFDQTNIRSAHGESVGAARMHKSSCGQAAATLRGFWPL